MGLISALILFPSLSFLVAARLLRIPTTLARAAGTGCVAAIASVALEVAGFWRPLRESQVGLSHRLLTNWMTMCLGTWLPATVAVWKLMAVRFAVAAGMAAVATALYLLLCVGPYALILYWHS